MRLNRFAICNEIFQGWKLEDSIPFAAQCGYDAVEIAPFTLAPKVTDIPATQRSAIVELAKRNNIAISGIHWVLAQTTGLHLNHPDQEVRRRTSDYLGHLVDFCADLGGKFIVLGSPKQRQVLEGVSPRHAWDWASQTFGEAVKKAEEREVTLCLEPLAPSETNFINTAAESIQFIKQFHSPRAKIILDVKAMSSESTSIPQIIANSWPHFAYFHANDPNLKGPGFGKTDFHPIARALHTVGYQGYVSVEVFDFSEGPEAIAKRSLEYLRKTFDGE
ncbi:MAG: sugar phosphate isomerase/epimerase [Verrucomicrobia bacterium]|nr:sugar phosphate isomerase/epimerase [Verrucomicrobiota bacterium]